LSRNDGQRNEILLDIRNKRKFSQAKASSDDTDNLVLDKELRFGQWVCPFAKARREMKSC